MLFRCEEQPQLGGLQPGLPVQHRGADLHRPPRPAAASSSSSSSSSSAPLRRPRGLAAGPRCRGPPTARQPGPQPDLPGSLETSTRSF